MSRILVIDDEAPMLKMLEDQLTPRGYEIVSADSGENGLELLKKDGDFDAALCDMKMPGMDGIEFLGEAKKIQPRLPVIIITGKGNEGVLDACLKAGAEDYLPKPFDIPTLEDMLARACKKSDRLEHLFDVDDISDDGDVPENPLEGSW